MCVEQYTHTLIAIPKTLRPTAAQLHAFLNAIVQLGVVPGAARTLLRSVLGSREVLNPFTGDMTTIPISDEVELDRHAIAEALHGLADFELEVSGEGLPTLPPLPLGADAPEAYFVGVTCVVSTELRSTSDTYNGFEPPLVNTSSFGALARDTSSIGYFSNLHNGTIIEVPDAGVARFWIEIELGKFLFPAIKNGLRILNPLIVQTAERIFGMEFAQGCHWRA